MRYMHNNNANALPLFLVFWIFLQSVWIFFLDYFCISFGYIGSLLSTSGTVVVGQRRGSLRGVPQWPKRHSFCDGQPEDGRTPSGGVVDA